jgi:RsiW-degrading membrane proteinase PrsW (M82 family)
MLIITTLIIIWSFAGIMIFWEFIQKERNPSTLKIVLFTLLCGPLVSSLNIIILLAALFEFVSKRK